MPDALSREKVAEIVEALDSVAGKDGCLTCECLHGFLAQIEMDAAEDAADLLAPLKVAPRQMHRCLGCNPCRPGGLFAEYLKNGPRLAGRPPVGPRRRRPCTPRTQPHSRA